MDENKEEKGYNLKIVREFSNLEFSGAVFKEIGRGIEFPPRNSKQARKKNMADLADFREVYEIKYNEGPDIRKTAAQKQAPNTPAQRPTGGDHEYGD